MNSNMNSSIITILKEFNDYQRLSHTLSRLQQFLIQQSLFYFQDELEEITSNYKLMLSFMSRGYTDNKRNELYAELIIRTYKIIQNIQIEIKKKENSSYRDAANRLNDCNLIFDNDTIRNVLESYVADMAMLTLEPEKLREEHKHRLLVEHDFYMNRLFDYILLSHQWNDSYVSFYNSLLTSPSIDIIDAQWIIGAISLACTNVFDLKKLEVLADVYVSDVSETLRQKAFVGWCMSLDGNQTLMVEGQKQTISMIVKHDNGIEILRELQIQMLTSINALYDEECIKRDIMPILLRQGNKEFPRLSKDITQPSDIGEILHPEDTEKMMQEAETAIKKMKEMANRGRDVYYGGFCQTKRYSFFSKLAHWFEPFFFENPEMEIELKKYNIAKKSLNDILSTLPLCDNDKYSFIILFSKMILQLPKDIFKVLAENRTEFPSIEGDSIITASYLRRNNLYDLFRFHQLYAMKHDFVDGFTMRGKNSVVNVFITDSRLFGEIQGYSEAYYDTLRFLDSLDTAKHEHYEPTISILLSNAPLSLRLSDRLFVANCFWRQGNHAKAHKLYTNLLNEYPTNTYVLRGAAKSLLEKKEYKEALNCYNRLANIDDNDINYQLSRSLCLIMLGNANDALPILHKLYYNNPENLDVVRTKLWAMMTLGCYTRIIDDYRILCKKCPQNANDHLNYGYCLWLSGQIEEAITIFVRYFQLAKIGNYNYNSIYKAFEKDIKFLLSQSLSYIDIHIMADVVDSRFNNIIN